MKHRFVMRTVAFLFLCCLVELGGPCGVVLAQPTFPDAIQIDAPDKLSTKIYSRASSGSELVGIALQGDIYEVAKDHGEFVEIVLPEAKITGYVLKADTKPWKAPPVKSFPKSLLIAIILAVVAIGGLAGFLLWRKSVNARQAAERAASIPAAIKHAEELFRAGNYGEAVREFRTYLNLQGGDVRNPDVYRRMSVCYQNMGEHSEAARAWEKMRSLGGLKSLDDYTLGVELMIALGREAEAAHIYEQLLHGESNQEKRLEIHEKLFDAYRKLRDANNLIRHAVALISSSSSRPTIVSDTVNFLINEGATDLAIDSGNKIIIKAICQEFLEEQLATPDAADMYLKCLEYDRTDQKLHKALAKVYSEGGDYRRAVSELTILHQLDRGQSDEYLEQAARIYVENARVQDAIAEGNPLIVKKIAQIYLARSEVNPDAIAIYEKVLEFQPKAVGINKMLSTVYLTRGDLEAYMKKLRLLHEIDGKNYDYLRDLAQCVVDNNLVEQTIREGNRDLNSKILKHLIKREAFDDSAVALFEKLVKVEPGNLPIRGALAKAYERREEYGKLLENAVVISEFKGDDELLERAAQIAVEKGLLAVILKSAKGHILQKTALKLVRSKSQAPECAPILEKALQEDPGNDLIKGYLQTLKPRSSAVPVAAAAPTVGPPRQKAVSPQVAGSKPSADVEPLKPVQRRPPVQEGTVSKPSAPAPSELLKKPSVVTRIPGAFPKAEQPKPVRTRPAPVQAPVKQPEAEVPGRRLDSGVEQAGAVPEGKPVSAPQAAAAPPEPRQFVQMTDPGVSIEEKAVTTFVSGYSQGLATQFSRENLFLPAAGGLAYKDLEILWRDTWGFFHRGVEVNTSRIVLLRVFRKDLLDPSSMKEFLGEVSQIGFNIVHDNILPLQETVTGPGGAVAMVHQFMPRNLELSLAGKKPPAMRHILPLAAKILEGLSYAHNYKGLDGKLRRTFHLHVQPAQILVNDEMTDCKIASLGYSQAYRNLTRATKPRWQEPGMNPATMPPEFFRAKSGSVRERSSEVYSFGILMHFMVTGEFPFEGPAFEDYKFQHTRIFAAPPRLTNPSVPEWLEQIILGCLEKEPEKRWNSITDVQKEFSRGMKSM